jgi:hypothetical protein
VDFSGQILSLGYGYLAKVVRAPSQVRTLMSKLANVNISLDRLRELADDNDCNSILQKLSQFGAFGSCETLLRSVETAIKICQHKDGQDVKESGKRIIWPLQERDTSRHDAAVELPRRNAVRCFDGACRLVPRLPLLDPCFLS